MTDEVKETVDTLKKLLEALSDDDFVSAQGRHVKKLFDEYIYRGFSRDEAIQLICASIKTSK
jgi:hypothetical protein